MCQHCLFCFSNRSRLIHHLRVGSLKCSLFYSSTVPEFSAAETAASMKAALSVKLPLGQTRLTADIPVYRAQGPIWEPPDPPLAP